MYRYCKGRGGVEGGEKGRGEGEIRTGKGRGNQERRSEGER